MKQSGYTSNELSHFVGHSHPNDHEMNYATLLKILDASCVTHPPHNKDYNVRAIVYNKERSLLDEGFAIGNVTCFCDIPISQLEIHTRKYGLFGLSFPREFMVKGGARPVFYIPTSKTDLFSVHGEQWLKDIEAVYRGFREHAVDPLIAASPKHEHWMGRQPESAEESIRAMDDILLEDILAFIKPFNADLPLDDPNNFYLEREWRRYGNLHFQQQNIARVFVSPDYLHRLVTDRPAYAAKAYPVNFE